MTTLILGGTGATGGLLVSRLLGRQEDVRVIVRSADRLPSGTRQNSQLTVTAASLLELSNSELRSHVQGCSAVVSCLGHRLSLRGVYGNPRRLVTDAIRRLADTILEMRPAAPIRLVLMGSAGVRNHDLAERVSFAERGVLCVLRHVLPPHADNEDAADYLRSQVDQDDGSLEWVVVRPDSLIDEDQVSDYTIHPSPTTSAIFRAGRTSRINVADFIVNLIHDDSTWSEWRHRMPVIYNK